MGRSGWQLETQYKVFDLVEALLTWADRKIEDGEELLYAIECEWTRESSDEFRLQIKATDKELNQLFVLFCEQERGKKIKSTKRHLEYLLKKLKEIKLLNPINDGTYNLQRVPGKFFYLKLPSKKSSMNLDHVCSLIAAQGSSTKDQLISGIEAQVRQHLYKRIHRESDRIRVFGIPELVDVKDVYTSADIWREIVNWRWQSLFTLPQSLSAAEHLDRPLSEGQEPLLRSGWDVAENLQLLRVLGGPSIGKTTYWLDWVAQWIEDRFQPDKIPIVVQLSYFAMVAQQGSGKNELLNFICSTWSYWGLSKESVQAIWASGKLLICVDALDEAPPSIDWSGIDLSEI